MLVLHCIVLYVCRLYPKQGPCNQMPLWQRRVRRGPDVAPAPGDAGHCVLCHLSMLPGTPTHYI